MNSQLQTQIETRLNKLYKEAPSRTIVGFENMPPLKGIIPKETIIDNGAAYYHIKNNDYIYEFIDILNNKNITDINTILNNIYTFINYYFGKNGNENKRQEIFNRNSFDKNYPDISVLRKQNAALCSERAAMAQNLFSFFGIESYYITGEANVLGEQSSHAFNIINYNGKIMLYDASLDVELYDEEEKIVGYRHYLQEISSNQLTKGIYYGSQFELTDYCFYMSKDKKWNKKAFGKRNYASGALEIGFDR